MPSDWGPYQRCTRCGGHDWRDRHTCPPMWLVCPPGYDVDDAWKIYAVDEEAAAELAADRWDSDGDSSICTGTSETFAVIDPARPDRVRRFEVSGEMTPVYRAAEVAGGR